MSLTRIRRGLLQGPVKIPIQRPRLIVDESGLVTLEEAYAIDGLELFEALPAIDSFHPTFGGIVLKGIDAPIGEDGVARVRLTYKGPQSGGTGSGSLPHPVYTIDTSASQEPIETNKRFENFAGSASDAKNGAKFEAETGIFQGFTDDNDFRGVTGFLSPRVTISVVRWDVFAGTGGRDVGKINTPSGQGASIASNNSSGSQNWLKIAHNATQYGNVWQISEQWLRSGDKGWNTDIYEQA